MVSTKACRRSGSHGPPLTELPKGHYYLLGKTGADVLSRQKVIAKIERLKSSGHYSHPLSSRSIGRVGPFIRGNVLRFNIQASGLRAHGNRAAGQRDRVGGCVGIGHVSKDSTPYPRTETCPRGHILRRAATRRTDDKEVWVPIGGIGLITPVTVISEYLL